MVPPIPEVTTCFLSPASMPLDSSVDIAPDERAKLERLCRYVSRPPVASDRLALTASGVGRGGGAAWKPEVTV